jgi:methylmalonyl-CoA mutase C-terminal domain/subunit
MEQNGLNDVLLTGGGIIPEEDAQLLYEMGVGKLFQPGTDMREIVRYLKNWVETNRSF